MRIATWNVNSLKARLEKLAWWVERARPDVVLLQETKLADEAAPREDFARLGYELAHCGQGRWNGVAVASRVGVSDVVANFGRPVGPVDSESGDIQPLAEARMIAARCGGVRVVSLYAPNGRTVGTQPYTAKLDWYRALLGWDVTEQPIGPTETYSMFTLRGLEVAAACTMRPEERQHGAPPHWNSYVSSADADESAKRAQQLGGQVLAPAFDAIPGEVWIERETNESRFGLPGDGKLVERVR